MEEGMEMNEHPQNAVEAIPESFDSESKITVDSEVQSEKQPSLAITQRGASFQTTP
jgi:hypothetical protein